MERFLFRLSESKYKGKFILKGALLIRVWGLADSRATLDIDTTANTSNSLDNLKQIIGEICEIKSSVEDGIDFAKTSIRGEVMQIHREYEGIRIRFEGKLGLAKVPMQMDVGFGDVITPSPKNILYPTLLNLPAPKLKSYPPETLIAEKIQTMVEKGSSNSRIKDFYDVWLLFQWSKFPLENLREALSRTFENRNTEYNFRIISRALNDFALLPTTNQLWDRFKQRELPHLKRESSFAELIRDILFYLKKLE